MKDLNFDNIKNELLKEYKKEQKRLNNLNDHLEIKNSLESLNYIKKEINKYDSLTNILKNENIDYRIMKLEKLYMQTSYDLSNEEFKNLKFDKKIEIFDNLFPNNWAISITKEKKLDLLLEAIIKNKIIETDNSKQRKLK